MTQKNNNHKQLLVKLYQRSTHTYIYIYKSAVLDTLAFYSVYEHVTENV